MQKTEVKNRPNLYVIFLLLSCVKLLLIPAYHSTDFEVHRNWLAVTHSLPISKWYISEKSQWTLDYPPFFAWFEYCLSIIASFVDPQMLDIDNLNYKSTETILFQRLSVIVTDFMLLCGVKSIGNVFHKKNNEFAAFSFLSLCNIGLLMVDHVHFQYNGFLIGMLLMSIAQVSSNSKINILLGAAWFTILLNFKHIYLYVVPAFTIWLLKWYCLKNGNFIIRLIELGIIVVTITAASFGPFYSQLPQVISRLFPFKRGLVHAYWAANFWALYISADKILSVIWKKMDWLSTVKTAAMTGGLVQEDNLTVLLTPTPAVTLILTFLSILPALVRLFTKKTEHLTKEDFVRCLILCALCSFMFGWHVHEKAILTAIIPLGILATTNKFDGKIFLILSSAGHTAISPLLFPHNLTVFRIGLLITYSAAVYLCLRRLFRSSLLYIHESVYLSILPLVTIYESIIHKLFFGEKLPFLPLALTSSYCAVGVIYSCIFYYWMYIFDTENDKVDSNAVKNCCSMKSEEKKIVKN